MAITLPIYALLTAKILERGTFGSLREQGRIESWMYQIERKVLADFYRRHMPLKADAVEDVVGPQGEDNGNENHNHAVGAWLWWMIDSLPQTLRRAVRMYEIEGHSQSEIANRLGISLSGAKSRVQRQLGELLRGSCQLELDRRGNVIACKPANNDGCAQVCECNDESEV